MKYPVFFFAPLLLLLGVLLLSSSETRSLPEPADQRWVNLSLRQIGHELLLAQCDDTGQIPAVTQSADHRYLLRLNRHLDYDQLVEIARPILAGMEPRLDYTLALEDCSTAEILLGYRWSMSRGDSDPACTGRDQEEGCHNISLTLHYPEPKISPTRGVSGGIALLGGLVLLLIGWAKPRRRTSLTVSDAPTETIALSAKTVLDAHNHCLIQGDTSTELTYRESRLLSFLSRHSNEILDREAIKAAVWESEGIITGRSLDVFVSRLRKKLAGDRAVEIETIRGRGYRLKTGL